MSKGRARARTVLFASSAATLYGGERSLLEIIEVMSPSWRPWFVVPKKGPYSAALDEAKYSYDVMWMRGLRYTPFFFSTAFRLAWIIRKRRASLVHANLQWTVPLVAAASRLTGVPFVAHLRNMNFGPLPENEAKPFRGAAAVICISRAVKDSACRAGLLSADQRDRIWIIPDARNLSKYTQSKRDRIRAELKISEDVPLIGLIARIDPMKGQHIFLESAALIAAQLPSARFLLVGDVMHDYHRGYLEKLKRRCADPRLKDRVTFLGYRTDVPDILAALDCFAHPSASGAFVSVLIEAMATGTPLVVPDVDGIPECVGRDGAAKLTENLAPEVWANIIMQVIRDPSCRATMARVGRERAKRYDATRLARETERVFEHCFETPIS